MIKKVLIAGLFLGGGYLFIKKILPKLQKQEYKADIKDYEVKRFYSNPTGGGGSFVEPIRNNQPFMNNQPIGNKQPFAVLTMAGQDMFL